MNREQRILIFLGKLQGKIEDLNQWAKYYDDDLFGRTTDLEIYFNNSIKEIFSTDTMDCFNCNKEITWKSLPK